MVDYKTIGQICSNIFAGGTPSTKREDYYDGDIPWIRSGEIDFNVIKSAERNITELGYKESSAKKIRKNSVVMAMTGATVAKSAVVSIETTANQSVCAMETNESVANYKYVYYCLAEDYLKIKSSAQGALTSLNLAMIKNIVIPIPSIDAQNHIVDILDTFTTAIDNLKKQIEERRKQYYYLVDSFFGGTFQNLMKMAEEGTIIVEPLSKHGTFTRGRRFVRTDIVNEGMPCIHYGDMYTTYGLYADKTITHLPTDFPKKMRYAHKGDVVIVGAGENNEDIGVGLVWQGEEPAAVHDACYIYEHDFEPLFLSYFLRSGIYHLQIKSHVVRGKICSISSDGIGKALIPVYDKRKQKEIVDSLLPFESLITNLEQQLAMRQKQYEYYRNKLLTFE